MEKLEKLLRGQWIIHFSRGFYLWLFERAESFYRFHLYSPPKKWAEKSMAEGKKTTTKISGVSKASVDYQSSVGTWREFL